jgi:hypothetical protein
MEAPSEAFPRAGSGPSNGAIWDAGCVDRPPWVDAELVPEVIAELEVLIMVYPDTLYVYREMPRERTHHQDGPVCVECQAATDDSMDPVARVCLRLDGANVTVQVSAVVPKGYPRVDGCFPAFHVRSASAARQVVAAVQDELDVEVRQQCALGAFTFLTIVGRATEMVAGIPLGLQSDHFGYCLQCNIMETRKARAAAEAALAQGVATAETANAGALRGKKIPQPLRKIAAKDGDDHGVTGGATEEDNATLRAVKVAVAVKKALAGGHGFPPPDTYECLSCHSRDNVIHLPGLKPNKTGLQCSFCYFDDNPMIDLICGCRSCFTCFENFTSIATGSKELRRCFRTSWVGVGCPNHRTMVVTDASLYKLSDTAAFLRFNLFAMQLCVAELNGFECCNPQCCGLPTISNMTGNKMRCAYCKKWSCNRCKTTILECRCDQWPLPNPKDRALASTVALLQRNCHTRGMDSLVQQDWKVLAVCGTQRVPIVLNSVDCHWERHVQHPLQDYLGDLPFLCIFHGIPLQRNHPLGTVPLYDGAIIYVIPELHPIGTKALETEIDLFNFRRTIASTENKEAVALTNGLYKSCVECSKPVIHYHSHGCHHIGFAGSKCCGHHWCYVCRGPYPCSKCTLMCNSSCGCPPCPDCKPMMPCSLCWGCDQCRGAPNIFE